MRFHTSPPPINMSISPDRYAVDILPVTPFLLCNEIPDVSAFNSVEGSAEHCRENLTLRHL